MRIAIYLCACGGTISSALDCRAISEAVTALPDAPRYADVDFICSPEGQAALTERLRRDQPERVVIAACSPRMYEATFRRCLSEAGLNPYLLQMVNIREQIAWVCVDRHEATRKTIAALRGAVQRVRLQEPLVAVEREVCTATLIIGGGPAGIKAALALAGAGRAVTLVERSAALGGLPVRLETLAPTGECASCLLEADLLALLHGEQQGSVDVLTLAEVASVAGQVGRFRVTIRQHPRHVSARCIGCGECTAVCPVQRSSGRKAIDSDFDGALPALPYLDQSVCLRFRGAACQLCQGACPVGPDVITYGDQAQLLEKEFGAIIVATGGTHYDISALRDAAGVPLPDVLDARQFQQRLAGCHDRSPLVTNDGRPVRAVAFVHCAGSLDARHLPYCSGVCCSYALTLSSQLADRQPEVEIRHYLRELVLPGRGGGELLRRVRERSATTFSHYGEGELQLVAGVGGAPKLLCRDGQWQGDLVVLCNGLTPASGAGELAERLDLPVDNHGFFRSDHELLAITSSNVAGIFLAGACREPMTISQAAAEGLAAAALVQAALQPGRMLTIDPVHAEVMTDRCSGCAICRQVCPYQAISRDAVTGRATVEALLCRGCGTCVAACPAGAIKGHHFTASQLLAELNGQLS